MVTLHISLTVRPDQGGALERLYREVYVPAITKQEGFRSTTLLHSYDSETEYEIDIAFDSEAQRQAWAASADHESTWPQVVALCSTFSAQGFEILA